MISIFLYIIIGLFISYYYFDKWYGEEYYIAKIKGEVEPAMVSIQLLLMTIIWPFLIIKDLLDND